MDFEFLTFLKGMISYYIKEMERLIDYKNITLQEYFEQYGIDCQLKAKTSCHYAYNVRYLEFILKRAFELGYLTNPNDSILDQVEKELENAIKKDLFPKYSYPIAKSSAELD